MKKNTLFIVVAALGVIVDRLTKILVENNLNVGDSLDLWPQVFHFTYVINTGAAFSFFTGGVGWLRWLSLAVSAGLILFACFGPKLTKVEQFGYGFILAGALGNGIDRFLFGHVI
ncbi:MAG: signal peptidase II, partial [Prochloraceae cyanobacterium]|nr:signal peptidase II [Prochloraceae cyanobacterium]